MRKILALSLLLASLSTLAQDVIVLKDSSTINSKVYEINKWEIKYKKHSNPNGPLYTLPIKKVRSVNYENGEKDLFHKVKEPKTPHRNNNSFFSYQPTKETNMYSNISLGYTSFGVKSVEPDYIDENYISHGGSIEYNFGFKPINNISLYVELGIKATTTFSKDVFEITTDIVDRKIGGQFKYLSIASPINLKYKINIPNSNLAICPYAGLYYKRNFIALQKNNWSKIDFITGVIQFDDDIHTNNSLKYRKNQMGWQTGLSIEFRNVFLTGFYSRDFLPIGRATSYFNKHYGSQFGFSLGYRFDM